MFALCRMFWSRFWRSGMARASGSDWKMSTCWKKYWRMTPCSSGLVPSPEWYCNSQTQPQYLAWMMLQTCWTWNQENDITLSLKGAVYSHLILSLTINMIHGRVIRVWWKKPISMSNAVTKFPYAISICQTVGEWALSLSAKHDISKFCINLEQMEAGHWVQIEKHEKLSYSPVNMQWASFQGQIYSESSWDEFRQYWWPCILAHNVS